MEKNSPWGGLTKEQILKVVDSAIQKWENVRDGYTADRGPLNCPLCDLFYPDRCDHCPVVVHSEAKWMCMNSPYDEWVNHHELATCKHMILSLFGFYKSKLIGNRVRCGTCKKIAHKEVEFLQMIKRRVENYCLSEDEALEKLEEVFSRR